MKKTVKRAMDKGDVKALVLLTVFAIILTTLCVLCVYSIVNWYAPNGGHRDTNARKFFAAFITFFAADIFVIVVIIQEWIRARKEH